MTDVVISRPRVGLVLDPRFESGAHPAVSPTAERPARIAAVRTGLEKNRLLEQLIPVPVPSVTDEATKEAVLGWIATNHSPGLIASLQAACLRGDTLLNNNPDTPIGPHTFDVTWQATGAVLDAVDKCAKGIIPKSFCVIRPPGHHAEHNRATGFCYVNHVAVATRYLLMNKEFKQLDGSLEKIERVLIIDFDLHHGNGAQDSFKDNPNVMFCSLHGHPEYLLYPGSGFEHERGNHGNILNIPFMPGASSSDYRRAIERQFLVAAAKFSPQIILVSAGFDMHRLDPLNMQGDFVHLDVDDYSWTGRMLCEFANNPITKGRIVSILEGGYNLQALEDCSAAYVTELLKTRG